jgi:IS30 family transposase
MKNHNKFTAKQRDLLASYLASGVNKSECARRLNRPRETILREIKRNSTWVCQLSGERKYIYIAISAQAKADKNKLASAYNKQELKNPDLYSHITSKLREGLSPEQIAGRLKLENPDDHHWHICHETIYRWIYKQSKSKNDEGLYWYEYLRRKQRKRKKQKGRRVHKSNIPDRISISQRSEAINNRSEFGHWEGDSIEGCRGKSKDGLHTEVERMSRRIKVAKVRDLTSKSALRAQIIIFKPEPDCAVKSTTLDNGKETHHHYKLRKKFNMDTFHAHPFSSGERGSNEHGNWHIRYYYPKKTDFSKVPNWELQEVVEEINNRPRKILGFKTANEVYYELLKKEMGCDD